MKKLFIPYEQALALKRLGFNEPCFGLYNQIKELCYPQLHYDQKDIWIVNTPTYSQACAWFRKKHNLCGWVQESYFKGRKYYQYTISRVETLNIIGPTNDSYEETELDCLIKLIEIVKDKNN